MPKKRSNPIPIKTRKLFEHAYFGNQRRIYWYIFKKVNNRELAEDLTAEVFIKLTKNHEILQERDENGVRAWLYTVSRNLVIDYLRKKGRSKKRVSADEELFDIFASDEPEYLEKEIFNEKVRDLKELVEQLNEVEKEIISLRFKDELNFNEIAKIIGKKEGAVKMILYRALERLREEIEPA
ncbi:RNA polymerase sigma factor [Candidatus Nomurabacteria bacterium]|nr:RNA polymerase sigma factor [Candidatus Nomurabacteria bacterium]